jgi:hypothetical protein
MKVSQEAKAVIRRLPKMIASSKRRLNFQLRRARILTTGSSRRAVAKLCKEDDDSRLSPSTAIDRNRAAARNRKLTGSGHP